MGQTWFELTMDTAPLCVPQDNQPDSAMASERMAQLIRQQQVEKDRAEGEERAERRLKKDVGGATEKSEKWDQSLNSISP